MSAASAIYGILHTIYSNFFIPVPVPQAPANLSAQTHIVTGANTGLGLELSRHLLNLGVGKLILAVRNPAAGETAKQNILKTTKRDASTVEVWILDMDDYTSISAFAARAQTLPRIDGIVANAGIGTETYRPSHSGKVEQTLNVNVIGLFLLFFLLLPKMREHHHVTGQRTTFQAVGSALHYVANLKELTPLPKLDAKHAQMVRDDSFARLSNPKTADMKNRYPLSKLLLLYLVREVAKYSVEDPAFPIVNCPNPSFCKSNLLRDRETAMTRWASKYLTRTTEEGSRTLFHALFAGRESHGMYLTNCHVQT